MNLKMDINMDLDMNLGGKQNGLIVMELFADTVPKTAEN